MSNPNNHRKHAVEVLAAALQECFDALIEVAEKRMGPRFERMDRRFEKIDTRLDKQDDTLRMVVSVRSRDG